MVSALPLAIVVFALGFPASLHAAIQSAPPITQPDASALIWQRDNSHPVNDRDVTDYNRLETVRRLIALSRQNGDLRALGKAEALLAQAPDNNLEVIVLSATIDQRKHHFDEAVQKLKRVLATQPDHPQANFTLYNVALVQADYEQAHSTCLRLGSIGYQLIEQSCRHNILGLKGQPQEAFNGLQNVLQNPPPHTPQERAWAQATLAELAADIQHPETPAFYHQALALAPQDHYSAASLADWYVQHAQPQEALAILKGRPASDRLDILRLIALRQSGSPEAANLQATLRERFSTTSPITRNTDNTQHLHERARFLLDIEQRPHAALTLAKRNYEVQKERSDKRLLERARRAAETER